MLKGVKSFVKAASFESLVIEGNNAVALGDGGTYTFSSIHFSGTSSGLSFVGNTMRGDYGATRYFYDSSSGTVTNATIASNSFYDTGTTAEAIKVTGTSGTVSKSSMLNFTNPCVGQKWFTTGNAITPGTITTLSDYIYTATVLGANQGDVVTITPSSTSWPVQNGIVITAYVSAPNTVSIKYTNTTAGSIGVAAHDLGILVTR